MSLSDWNFPAQVYGDLDTGQYAFPPSSLKAYTDRAEIWHPITCLKDNCAQLIQGAVEFYYRRSAWDDCKGGLAVRQGDNASPLTDAPCFHLHDDETSWGVYWHTAGSDTLLGSFTATIPNNSWLHYRLSWWVENGSLIFRLEEGAGTGWSLVDADINTLRNDNVANTYQAVALLVIDPDGSSMFVWYDDVRVYSLSASL